MVHIKGRWKATNPETMPYSAMSLDAQRYFCQRMFDGMMPVYITERYDDDIAGQSDPEHAAEHKAVVPAPKDVCSLALVCKLWHEELQLRRNKEVGIAVAHFINVVPEQAISLVNVDLFTAADYAGLPAVTKLVLSVYLGSREVFAIALQRTRASEGKDEHELSVMCRGCEMNGAPWVSKNLVIPVHALCAKEGDSFSEADMETYDAWHDATATKVRAWLTSQLGAWLTSECAEMTAAA